MSFSGTRGKDRAFATVPECAFPNIYLESVSASDTNFPWFHPVVITGKEDADETKPGKALAGKLSSPSFTKHAYILSIVLYVRESQGNRSKRTGLV